MTQEKIAVIGSNSFSGATFVAHALQAGAQVIGISRSPEAPRPLLPYQWAPHEHFQFYQLDLNHDTAGIMARLKEFQPDYVVNFAAQSMVPQSWQAPADWYLTNVVAMVRLHDQLRKCDFLKRYVHISTPEVYGSTSGTIKESTNYNPSTPYAASKAACDLSLMTFLKAYRFPVVFTRAANVCGAGQPLYRIIPKTIYCVMTGTKLKLQGGGHSVRSFINMRDVAEGTLRAARRGQPGDIFHFATAETTSIRALVEEICRQLEVRFADVVEETEGRLGLDSAYLLDCEKARRELDWRPEIPLTQTIREMIAWMKEMWPEIQRLPTEYVHKP